jgi:hypothetical protein
VEGASTKENDASKLCVTCIEEKPTPRLVVAKLDRKPNSLYRRSLRGKQSDDIAYPTWSEDIQYKNALLQTILGEIPPSNRLGRVHLRPCSTS